MHIRPSLLIVAFAGAVGTGPVMAQSAPRVGSIPLHELNMSPDYSRMSGYSGNLSLLHDSSSPRARVAALRSRTAGLLDDASIRLVLLKTRNATEAEISAQQKVVTALEELMAKIKELDEGLRTPQP